MVLHAYLFPEKYTMKVEYSPAGDEMILWQLPSFYVLVLTHQIEIFLAFCVITLLIIYLRWKKIKNFYYHLLKGVKKLDG